MSDEQVNPEEASIAEHTNQKTTSNTGQSDEAFNNEADNESYYSVDNPKKEVISTIGDGEMLNEGTVGMGDTVEENPFSATQEEAD
jgi:hypothetical protein